MHTATGTDDPSGSLEQRIRDRAAELGFSACGFALCADLTEEQHRFEAWLAAGHQAGMGYLERYPEVRFHPSMLAEGCAHVVVVLLNYHRTDYLSQKKTPFRVAEYALGRDYHAVMREKLHQLAAFMETLGQQVRTRCCVDTAPVMEKALAVRAGLGWRGRNTLLVTPAGSKFFIGEVFTSLPLRSDSPMDDGCGLCRRCVEACPAGALGRVNLDARRCLSYQTIERKELSLSHAAAGCLGTRIYGCDVCQDVCPYNRHAPETEVADFLRRPEWFGWTEEQWRQMDAETYRKQFKDSAMQRIGFEKLKENIRVAEAHLDEP